MMKTAHFAKGDKSIEFIINCANEEFAQNGSKTTLNGICEKYKISKGRMYHFFTSKEDLLCNCFKYSLEKVANAINDFEIDKNASLEDNLHNYYNEIINHWLKNPNDIITIERIAKMSQVNFSEKNYLRLKGYKNEWADCVTGKFLQIIKSKKVKMRVNETVIKQIISAMYQQMFLNFSNDLISALKSGNYRLAKEKKKSLLRNYDILIDAFLNGIAEKEY
ncbi:MAG: TetR/AcrR family transcriptional regulator [Eubacteriales bacterium]|nr:TetR/AcrR family transcriptional regulator [Eubacteriales bacterium]